MPDIEATHARPVSDVAIEIAVLRAEVAALDRLLSERHKTTTELLLERRDALDKALTLQTRLNEDHLAALNGEQARLQQERDRFVSQDVFAGWVPRIEALERGDSGTRGRDRGINLAFNAAAVAIGVAIAIVGFISSR